MNSDFRRIIVAMLVALAIFLGYRAIIGKFFPPPEKPPSPVSSTGAPSESSPASGPVATGPTTTTSAPTTTGAASTRPIRELSIRAADDTDPVTIGGHEGDALRVTLDPRGASLASLWLFSKDKKGHFVHRARPGEEEPYELLSPSPKIAPIHFSFATHRVWIKEFDNEHWALDTLAWTKVPVPPGKDEVVFTTGLRSKDGAEMLRFTKTYRLHTGKPVLDLDLSVENVGDSPLTIWVDQDGPINVPEEGLQYDLRQLLTAQYLNGNVKLGRGHRHADLLKAAQATDEGQPIPLLAADNGRFLWTALTNKYFGVFTRPLPATGEVENYVVSVTGTVADKNATTGKGDLLARITTVPILLQPAGTIRYPFEVYAGAKDAGYLASVDPAYADHTKLYYQLTQSADRRCSCTFGWLQDMMVWLLESIHVFVRNYGVAIIILVIIVRGLLHPLSVFQQKSMFRMQEAMGKLQPKMNALKEKYANDKTKLNQEMMKLFGEENVNPAANFVSFIPLFLQMPILVALWTALNTDVNLRHAPFDGWWITDLSAPDALWAFVTPLNIPILSELPLVGRMFTGIPSINVLPLLMGVSMWLQQKYMPKPHLQAKMDAARKQHAESGKPKSGMSPDDQMRQQQIMSYMMSIMMPLMFYYMPSGLNLYWMATNVVGILESLIIRKQLDEEKKRRELAAPKRPKKPSVVGRFFKHLASQAEELQRKADEIAKTEESKKKQKKP